MAIREYKCTRIIPNNYMGAECWQDNMIFLFDRDNLIKVGDVVKIERDPKNNYVKTKMWVNGVKIGAEE